MQPQTRFDLFEPGDLTALVCIEEPDVQSEVLEQLGLLNYKIHTGLFGEDVSLKLRTHVYDILVIHEHFGGVDIEHNQALNEFRMLPINQRRKQVCVVVGSSMVTGDSLQAFSMSVDMVLGVSDIENLRLILRRVTTGHKNRYSRMNECMEVLGMA